MGTATCRIQKRARAELSRAHDVLDLETYDEL